MLQLNQVRLRRGTRILFEDATFQAHAGQRVGVTGANGSGKSSLFELILGGLQTDAGEISLQAGCRIAAVAQETPDSERSALDFVLDGDIELRAAEAAIRQAEAGTEDESEADAKALARAYEAFEDADGYAARARAGALLHGLGFEPEQTEWEVSAFSGGWRVRLALAQALMRQSDLLLLDEPTNHLDLPAILWLENWLARYPGLLLVISHDRDFLDAVCTRIAHIEQQHVTLYGGNYSQFEEVRTARLAQQQAMHEKQQKEIRHIQSFVDRFRYKASKARQAQSRLRMLERMTLIAPAHVDSPFHFTFLEPGRQPQHLLKMEDAQLGYAKGQPVLSNVNLGIEAGQRLGLLGVNGAGKSTLVRALADGSTLLSGQRIVHRDTVIGYFAQHQLEQLDPQQSPLAHLQSREPGSTESELRQYLGRFGFAGERIFDPVAPFSGGEKARLVLALLIRLRPNLLLLDEPTNHLDLEMRQALSMALNDYSGALVVIAHDRHLLRTVCDELIVVHDGMADRFDRSLDDYAAWLTERDEETTDRDASTDGKDRGNPATSRGSQRARRQEKARAREALKPLRDRVQRIEKEMNRVRMACELLERKLADDALYNEPERRDELTGLVREQGEARSRLEQLEEDWLAASEALECARGDQ
ncbi:ABC-F family ATP-binding cassette domain-containing protein [Elongatibacter sediminis]|uniref:Probable ATP-binding protein YheS n=1 Tax=Elongatibacter sediminis TaxID=3119006 RepID=A0AAW9RG03_9GAMM